MTLLLALLALFFAPPPARPAAFATAVPGYRWSFPADDFAHPAFANEWWYFTGNLQAADGRRFGFELTFFRISPSPGADLQHDLYFTHFAITDITDGHYFYKELARRGDWSQAGIVRTASGFTLYNENWRADFSRSPGLGLWGPQAGASKPGPPERQRSGVVISGTRGITALGPAPVNDASGPRHLHAVWDGESLDLALSPGARMLNGVNGWSQKGSAPGQASYYYSFPHIEASGAIEGVPAAGLVWMDHEFASNQLGSNQQGWDWMGLHLPDADLMLFNLRDTNGARDPHSAGTLQPRSGASVSLHAADFRMTPLRWWHAHPVAWRVQVPSQHLDLTVTAEFDNQEFHAPASGVDYWEGAVSVSGTRGGTPVTGEGYLELTGYARRFDLF